MNSNVNKVIIQHTQHKYETVEQVSESLTALEKLFRANKDNRGIFALAYNQMTELLRSNIDDQQKGDATEFNDIQWLKDYLLAFANLYRTALYGSVTNQSIPHAWRISFEKTKDRGILSIQHLLLGVNAHIKHDLPLALYQVGIGKSVERDNKEEDHIRVNNVLKAAIDPIQRSISGYHKSKGLGVLDTLFLRLDEWITSYFFQWQRDYAWYNAIDLRP